jgi:hypothetical protein
MPTKNLLLLLLPCLALLTSNAAAAREPGDPITLAWTEGDVAGLQRILSPDGKKTIGYVEYHQHRRGDVLEAIRVSRFTDGSSDEDHAEARVGKTLEAIRGRSIIRDVNGKTTVDLTIDVAAGRITGFSGLGDERKDYDEKDKIPLGTYWGPLMFIVVKNFEQNADGDRLVFHTIAPTPKPRSIDMELVREESTTLALPGSTFKVTRFALRPTVNWLLDPIIQRIAPETKFFVIEGSPPALARFEGPRNYAGQRMVLQ